MKCLVITDESQFAVLHFAWTELPERGSWKNVQKKEESKPFKYPEKSTNAFNINPTTNPLHFPFSLSNLSKCEQEAE